jgi:uncharacterized protein (TIGR04141 family)
VKAGLDEDAVFRSGDALAVHTVSDDSQRLGRLYLRQSGERPPGWLRLFAARTTPAVGHVRSKNASAVWLIPVAGRLFAVTFGYGRMLLAPGAVEDDFGLKVTLNCVDPNKVQSIDRTTLDTISRHSQIQASHLAPIGEFGLDAEQDILQAVTGVPTNPSVGKKLAGKDSLHATVNVEFSDVHNLLEKYLGLYQSTRYKEFFSFVDHIRLIRDPERMTRLNDALVVRIRLQARERLWLSIPEAIDWKSIDHFRYRPGRQKGKYDDLHFDQLADELADISTVDLDRLRHVKVEAISADNDLPIYEWQLFKCIYHEISDGEHTYVLNNGKWYEVASDFATAVSETCRAVRPSDTELPEYRDRGEAAYNLRVAAGAPNRFICLDKAVVVFPVSPSRIEFCDIYTNSREMIFVKRYGDSSVLSHLFAQGVVSAETFRRERKFRELVNDHLPPQYSLGALIEEMKTEEFTITFAIVSESARPLHDSLPFFSKVNLRNAVKLLESNGYKVRLAKIRQVRRRPQE